MKFFIYVGSLFLLVSYNSAFGYTFKCKNEAGKFVYTSKPCSQFNNEMHDETIAINGQRKLTSEQASIIEDHHKEEQRIRGLEAEQLSVMDKDKLLKIEADRLREKKKKAHKWF